MLYNLIIFINFCLLQNVMHLSSRERPFLHCSTIPVILLILSTIISYKFKSTKLFRYGWLIWTAFISHHIRDANRRGLWFYPFGSTPPLSSIFYIFLILFLPYSNIYFIKYLTSDFKYYPSSNYSFIKTSSHPSIHEMV